MEDTTVFPGYYAYMLRVDISLNLIESSFKSFREKYKPYKFIIGAEYGTMTNKEHIQGILWFESKICNSSVRQYWKKLNKATHKNSVAITSAKKIQNLAKYCMKDCDFVTNLTDEERNKIGTWIQGENTYQFKQLLYEYCKNWEYIPSDVTDHQTNLPIRHFINAVLEFYRKHDKKPNKNQMDYILWRYKYTCNYTLINKWYPEYR